MTLDIDRKNRIKLTMIKSLNIWAHKLLGFLGVRVELARG